MYHHKKNEGTPQTKHALVDVLGQCKCCSAVRPALRDVPASTIVVGLSLSVLRRKRTLQQNKQAATMLYRSRGSTSRPLYTVHHASRKKKKKNARKTDSEVARTMTSRETRCAAEEIRRRGRGEMGTGGQSRHKGPPFSLLWSGSRSSEKPGRLVCGRGVRGQRCTACSFRLCTKSPIGCCRQNT